MKSIKTAAFLLLLFFGVLLTASCSNGNNSETAPTAAPAGEEIIVPEKTPDLMGRVIEVIGNEVTIYKMEGNFAQGMGQRQANSGADSGDQGEQQEQIPDTNNSSPNNQEQRPENTTPRVTTAEEKEAFIIPVGTPIVMMQRGSTEPAIVGLTEIKKEQILRIWKNDEDTVEFVQLMGGAGQRSGSGQGPGFGGGGFPGGMPPGGMGGPR
ncbi:MAG: hypothetical protein ACOWWO_04760 [Peptococcaceae bacterium]